MSSVKKATLMAGIPAANMSLYHKIRFSVLDPAAVIELLNGSGATETTLLLRDIEMERARRHARVDHVRCSDEFRVRGRPLRRPGDGDGTGRRRMPAPGRRHRRGGCGRPTSPPLTPLVWPPKFWGFSMKRPVILFLLLALVAPPEPLLT